MPLELDLLSRVVTSLKLVDDGCECGWMGRNFVRARADYFLAASLASVGHACFHVVGHSSGCNQCAGLSGSGGAIAALNLAVAALSVIALARWTRSSHCRPLPQKAGSIMRSIYETSARREVQLSASAHSAGFSSEDRCASASARASWDKIWRGKFFTLPFLYLGSWRQTHVPRGERWHSFHDQELCSISIRWAEKPSPGFETSKPPHPRRFDAYRVVAARSAGGTDHRLPRDARAFGRRHRSECRRARRGYGYVRAHSVFTKVQLHSSFPLTFSGVADVCRMV